MPFGQEKVPPMPILIIWVNAKPEKRSELLSALRLFRETIEGDTGCLGYHINQDVDDPNRITIDESWARDSDMEAHFRSDVFSALLGAVKLLGKSHETLINKGFNTEGIETIEKSMSGNG